MLTNTPGSNLLIGDSVDNLITLLFVNGKASYDMVATKHCYDQERIKHTSSSSSTLAALTSSLLRESSEKSNFFLERLRV